MGFALYLVSLGLQRALITDPLVARSGMVPKNPDLVGKAFTCVLVFASAMSGCLLIIGTAIREPDLQRSLITFAAWLIPLLVQDFWRVILFMRRQPGAAALNDTLWLIGIGIASPLLFFVSGVSGVITVWAAGGAAGAALGFWQTRVMPRHLKKAFSWWRVEAWPLGRWLLFESFSYTAGGQGVVFILYMYLGANDIGGLRAVQAAFAPLTLLIPAIALPGLPAISRAYAQSRSEALKLVRIMGLLAFGGTAIYTMTLWGLHGSVLAGLFGNDFVGFAPLILPIAAAQLAQAGTVAYPLLLKVENRGKVLLVGRTIGTLVLITVSWFLVSRYGILGGAWGMSIGAAIGAIAVAVGANRQQSNAA